jgi:hypothetical protein
MAANLDALKGLLETRGTSPSDFCHAGTVRPRHAELGPSRHYKQG